MTPARKRRKTGNDGLCLFCASGTDNPQKYGQKLEMEDITVHYFCMLFASGLSQNGKSDKEGILGFLLRDIFCEVKRGRRLRCTYCKKTGATVGCVKSNCRRAFHFGCGRENGALSQFFGNFSSYCQDHCPKQVVPVRDRLSFHGTANSICAICMSAVEARASNSTLRAPCCKNAWFHRSCMQRQAIYSGIHFFKCALCNNKDIFQDEMLTFGIYIPDQDAAWELEPNAYHDLLERHSQCDVTRCLCNQGRRYNKDNSNWEIILCDWCGSKGTHIICSAVDKSSCNDWICDECSNVASKMGSTKKSRGKKPQIDDWLKKKLASFSRLSKKTTKRKKSLATGKQSHNIRKRCRTNTVPNISATATSSSNKRRLSSSVWAMTSANFTAISPKPSTKSRALSSTTSTADSSTVSSQDGSTKSSRHSSTSKTTSSMRRNRPCSFRGRILRKNFQDSDSTASSPDISKGEIVGCVIPASMSMPSSNAAGRSSTFGASKTEDFQGKPRWYRQLMTEDYLTGRRLGAKWTDDLCVIKYAEQSEIANSCSTAVGCVDSKPTNFITTPKPSSVATSSAAKSSAATSRAAMSSATMSSAAMSSAATSSASTSDSEDVVICPQETPAVSQPETPVEKPAEIEKCPSTKLPTRSPFAVEDSSTCDSYPMEILPICDDYRVVLDDVPRFDEKAGLSGTCSWNDDNANYLCLNYCPPIEIDLTQDTGTDSTTSSCLPMEKTPEYIDLTELQELEQDGWSETGTDSGIGDSCMMYDPPCLSRPSAPPPLSRAPDAPPVLTAAVSQAPYTEYGGRVYRAPLVNVGYFTIGPVTSYR